jgi:hypothetical protein
MIVKYCYKSNLPNYLVSRFIVFAYSLALCSLTYAQVYELNSLLTTSQGYTVNNSFQSISFAQLVATRSGGRGNIALRNNNNLFGSFGDGQYIGSMSFDFTPATELPAESAFIIGSNALVGVESVSGTSGTGQIGLTDADISTQFGRGNHNRLSDNDWAIWNNSGLPTPSSLTSKYLHLPGIIAKYPAKSEPIVAYPVPEPETYAMLLAGLALIAFTARHRNEGFSN